MSYRIIKVGDGDYHVETRCLGSWLCMHSTPGFPTEEKAREYLKYLTNPEVIGEFRSDGTPVQLS